MSMSTFISECYLGFIIGSFVVGPKLLLAWATVRPDLSHYPIRSFQMLTMILYGLFGFCVIVTFLIKLGTLVYMLFTGYPISITIGWTSIGVAVGFVVVISIYRCFKNRHLLAIAWKLDLVFNPFCRNADQHRRLLLLLGQYHNIKIPIQE